MSRPQSHGRIWSQEEIKALDAEEFNACKQAVAESDLGSQTPAREAALGWLIAIQCRSNGYACQGQLIAYEAETDMHHLLYTDGEDEWLCLAKESTQWIRHLDRPIAPGLPAGIPPPFLPPPLLPLEAADNASAVHWPTPVWVGLCEMWAYGDWGAMKLIQNIDGLSCGLPVYPLSR